MTRSHAVELRPVVAGDGAALARDAGDPRVAATCNVPHPLPLDGARGLLDAAERGRARGDDHIFAIVVDGDARGVASLSGRAGGVLALGYWVAAALWNRGVATAAARLAVAHAFDVLRAPGLVAATLPDNHASIRVLAKLGFRCAGAVRNSGRFGRKFRGEPMVLYTLDRGDGLPDLAPPT